MPVANTQWIEALFGCIDRKDTDGFMTYLSESPVFQFGNAPPVEGWDAVRATVAGFFSAIRSLEHRLLDTWTLENTAVCRGQVCYERLDGSRLEIPFATIFKLEGGRIRDYLIYADASALFSGG